MSLRYNEETQQVERERVEYDVVTRPQLEESVTVKQGEVDAAKSEVESARKLLSDSEARFTQLEEELEDLKSDVRDFDETAPVSEEDSDEVTAEGVGGPDADPAAPGEGESTPVPVQF